jgi:hypothetical protein
LFNSRVSSNRAKKTVSSQTGIFQDKGDCDFCVLLVASLASLDHPKLFVGDLFERCVGFGVLVWLGSRRRQLCNLVGNFALKMRELAPIKHGSMQRGGNKKPWGRELSQSLHNALIRLDLHTFSSRSQHSTCTMQSMMSLTSGHIDEVNGQGPKARWSEWQEVEQLLLNTFCNWIDSRSPRLRSWITANFSATMVLNDSTSWLEHGPSHGSELH